MVIQLKSNIKNDSLQINDVIYRVTSTNVNGLDVANDPSPVGSVIAIGTNTITIDPLNGVNVSQDDFLMFSKNKFVNNSSLLGYYAEIKMINDSTDEAELFAVSSEIAPSSK